MYGLYVGHLYTAHRYALSIETLLHEIDLHAEMIVSLAHCIVNEMLLDVLEHNKIVSQATHNAAFLVKQVINTGCFDVRDNDVRHIVMITQYAAAVENSDRPNIGRVEAIKTMEYCNDIADLVEYNGYTGVYIRIPRNFDADENQRQHVSHNDLNLSPSLLNKIVTSIVETIPTDSIYIFGSYSRLEETKISDIDIYIITSEENTDGYDVKAMGKVKTALKWWRKPKDIICSSKKYFNKKSQVNFSLEQKVMTKGVKIYGLQH